MIVKVSVLILFLGVCGISGQTYQDYVINIPTLSPSTGSTAKATVTAAMGAYRLKVISPVNSFIRAACSITVPSGHRFVISRSGETILTKDGINFATSGTLPSIMSIGNEIVVAGYTYTCTFTAVPVDNTNCDCGWKKSARIVGGSHTTANEFVSHVGLVEALPSDKNMFCGGTIISQTHVISAAHCFEAYTSTKNLQIYAGYQDFTKVPAADTPWSSIYPIVGWRKHPSFNPNTNGVNDIAIVYTNYIRFTLGVGPGCLPFTYNKFNFEGKSLTAVGWGTIGYGEELSNILKKVNLNVISNANCSLKMNPIDPTNMCTFVGRSGDSCQHDSGGGLYYDINNTYKYFIAVINYGIGCAGNYPSVNTRVDYYFSFIVDNTSGVHLCRK